MNIAMLGLITLSLLATLGTAQAETFPYICKVAGGDTHLLKVDTTKMILEWQGKKYRLKDQPNCGRGGWRATGQSTFDFCYATQAYASSDQLKIECQQLDVIPSVNGDYPEGYGLPLHP
jgi:hypothetical protein